MTAYDYSVDLWAAGCILAGLLFWREPFFRGRDNVDQLAKVAGILGTEDLAAYCRKYGVVLRPDVRGAVFGTSSDSDTESEGGRDEAKGTTKMAAMERNVPRKRKRPWRDIPPPADAPPIPPEGIDLVDRLLRYDHAERPTAVEAMAHPFFDEVRETIEREWAEENAAREEKEVTSPSNFLQ
uniref:non-specific serine/threonine protein kinase n=1 Tax=Corethron hystrix TaxID=216773 RepID=A0A7S1FZG7_9STRA